jgi:hypothetical protein
MKLYKYTGKFSGEGFWNQQKDIDEIMTRERAIADIGKIISMGFFSDCMYYPDMTFDIIITHENAPHCFTGGLKKIDNPNDFYRAEVIENDFEFRQKCFGKNYNDDEPTSVFLNTFTEMLAHH